MNAHVDISSNDAKRYLVVRIPDWPTSSLGLSVPPGAPAVTVHKGRVCDVSLPARRLGVKAGMKVSSAQLLAPHVIVLPADDHAQQERFETVLHAIEEEAAHVRIVHPGVAWAFARGLARWHGSEEQAAEAIIDAISTRVGLESRVGIGSGTLCALVASLHGQIVPEGQERQFLQPIPLHEAVSLLAQGQKRYGTLVEHLELLGIKTCGEVAACDERTYIARFGVVFRELRVLCCGGDVFYPDGERQRRELTASYTLEDPETQSERLMIPMTRVAKSLVEQLEAHGCSAGALVTRILTETGQEYHQQWGPVDIHGSEIIVQRLLWHINSLAAIRADDQDALSGGIIRLELQAHGLRESLMDAPLWGTLKEDLDRQRSIEHVHTLLGDGSVLHIQSRGSFDPRHSVATRPWGQPSVDVPPTTGQWTGRVSDPPEILCVPPTRIHLLALTSTHSTTEVKATTANTADSDNTGNNSTAIDITQPDITQPDITQPDTTEPDITGSGSTASKATSSLTSRAESGSAQIIAFPGMPHAESHPTRNRTEPHTSTHEIPVTVSARGQITAREAWLILQERSSALQLQQWGVGQKVHVILREPVWTIRGRWWEAGSGGKDEGCARSYVRACSDDGVEMLLVCRGSSWFIEGVYDRSAGWLTVG